MKSLKTKSAETARLESDSDGFEALFLEHWASVYRILQRLVGNPAEAEDLALEAFLRLYHQTRQQSDDLNAGGWLYRVATNSCFDAIARDPRRSGLAARTASDAPEDAGATAHHLGIKRDSIEILHGFEPHKVKVSPIHRIMKKA